MLKLPKNNFVFLETNKFDKHNSRSYLFSNPIKIVAIYKLEDVKNAFLEIENFISKGYYAAGFISYEAGVFFEESLNGLTIDSNFPLLWFGIYKKPNIFIHKDKLGLTKQRLTHQIRNLRANISKNKYTKDIRHIKDFIKNGDTYQVNYTFKYKFDFKGSLLGFYEDLKAKQSVSYSALIKTQNHSILSFSPELFFRKNRDSIEVRPMKGTFDRGRDIEGDRRNTETLEKSLKNRSENVMIVDLLRNDLGRISKSGSVKTKKLFEVEQYETLLQMISVVKSRLKKDVSLYDLFKAIFPSGSVTGAPKISTMKIIDSLEKEPRRIYTGGIGFFTPSGDAVFNVAIRTALIDNKTKKGEMGIGSGIVIDSDAAKEFEECKLKANFITQEKRNFKLIETMLWQRAKGYFLLSSHLERLKASAEYFNFRFDKKTILKSLEKKFNSNADYKVRLLLDKSGDIDLSFSKINGSTQSKVRFSNKKVSSENPYLYHKSTNRDLYNKEHTKWKRCGYFDIIFRNEKNQITEGAISNIIIKKGQFYYTPPLECGLLNGVYRKSLLNKRQFPLREKILYKKDLCNADKVYMVNSVRGMVECKVI
ncbi:MAG: aminodeoxychorismate synthase component I [Candidatus Gorgyraea atricola]|nr:aminodeoxychorismate synthase component I [Candidatus Gorgyraea atricola]